MNDDQMTAPPQRRHRRDTYEDGRLRPCIWCGDLTSEYVGVQVPGKTKAWIWNWRDACHHDQIACQKRRFEKRR